MRPGALRPPVLLRTLLGAALVLAVGAGCTVSEDGTASAGSSADAASSAGTGDCTTGDCTVEVTAGTEIPAAPGTGVASLQVESIASGRLGLRVEFDGNAVRTRCGTGCSGSRIASIGGGPSTATTRLSEGAEFTANGVLVEVGSIDGDSAVLRITQA